MKTKQEKENALKQAKQKEQEYKSVIDRLNKKGSLKDFDLDDYAVYINENGEFKKSSKGYVIYELIW